MKRFALLVIALVLLSGCSKNPTGPNTDPQPTATETSHVTPLPTVASSSFTATPTPTISSPAPTSVSTSTPTFTKTSTPIFTATPTFTITYTPSPTATPSTKHVKYTLTTGFQINTYVTPNLVPSGASPGHPMIYEYDVPRTPTVTTLCEFIINSPNPQFSYTYTVEIDGVVVYTDTQIFPAFSNVANTQFSYGGNY